MKKRDVDAFRFDVSRGLKATPKSIPSIYFYDRTGSEIFQEIMSMEEYYLPRCEEEILRHSSHSIARSVDSDSVEVIELGAGDGSKTVLLLEALCRSVGSVRYIPLDVSEDVLVINRELVRGTLPSVVVDGVAGDLFHTLPKVTRTARSRIVLFLGSSIGNFTDDQATALLHFAGRSLREGDLFVLGIDLVKDEATILNAYNDSGGVTRRFNLNLLKRINEELGANFNLNAFEHVPEYNSEMRAAVSRLRSLDNQVVTLGDGTTFSFTRGELVQTEISRKYDLEEVRRLHFAAGLSVTGNLMDSRGYYAVTVATPRRRDLNEPKVGRAISLSDFNP